MCFAYLMNLFSLICGFLIPQITLFYFLHCAFKQAKLSLRLEYIPPKPGKSVEGDITATDETDLGAELDDEFGLQEEEGGVDELEGGGAAGVSEAAR